MRSVTQSNSTDPADWKLADRPHEERRVYRHGRPDWSKYGPCPRCPAGKGEPCLRFRSGPYPGLTTTDKVRPHDWRPVLKVRADAQ
jgi:hypothetical protein